MKSILIINTPEDFDYRKCKIGGDGNIYYERKGEQRTSIIGNIKNLKPIPQRKEGFAYIQTRDGVWHKPSETGYAGGWNACIETILGENND